LIKVFVEEDEEMSIGMRPSSRKRKSLGPVWGQKGFTLVEILVAIAILGVVVVAFLSALTTAYGAVVVADRHTKAESLTRTAFEYMRNLPYETDFSDPSAALPAAWIDNVTPIEYGYPYLVSGDRNYKVQVTSTENLTSRVKEIVVAVLYRDTTVDTTTTYRSDPNRNF
jgi:prepilin-type N-terminal cleavage/methylation domain-containing protein